MQGGFAVQGRGNRRGEVLTTKITYSTTKEGKGFYEGILESRDGALICSDAGASGIRHPSSSMSSIDSVEGKVLKPDANTNLMWQRTLIPIIDSQVQNVPAVGQVTLTAAVFSMARRQGLEDKFDSNAIDTRWRDVPVVRSNDGKGEGEYYISIACT